MRQAIDLFGGDKVARQKMTRAVRDALKRFMLDELREMEQAYRLKPSTLVNLSKGLGGEEMVDYPLFEALAPSFRLSIREVLGEPKFSTTDLQMEWEVEMRENPLRFAGGMNGGEPELPLKLKSYLVARAIEELNANQGSHSVLNF
jgi:hypothetical protein